MPQFDFATFPTQLFWLAVSFVALYLLMTRLALPRVAQALEARRDHIDDDLEAAERFRSEAEQAMAGYERIIAKARSEAQTVLRESAQALAAETAARQAELARRIAEETKAAEARIAQARTAALANIRAVAAEAAAAAVTKLSGVAAEPRAVEAAVDAALGERT